MARVLGAGALGLLHARTSHTPRPAPRLPLPRVAAPGKLSAVPQRGDLLAARPISLVGTHPSLLPASGTHLTYVSADSRGRLLPTTGALLRSHRPWQRGPRPLIVFAPSTQGVAPSCDPSASCAVGIAARWRPHLDLIMAYEQPVIGLFLASGADVVLTDYPRDPATGTQLYCEHRAGAAALVDAVRAARTLGVSEEAPLGVWGFSQGGGSAGALLEDPPSDCPWPVRAGVVGAPPSRLDEVLRHVDGSLVTGVIAYSLAAFLVDEPAIQGEVCARLSPAGIAAVEDARSTCAIGAALRCGWRDSSTWTRDGQPLADTLDDAPALRAALTRRRLGHSAPTVPVLLWCSTHDDVVPPAQVRALRSDWEARGAQVSWRENSFPRIPGRLGINHFGPYYRHAVNDAFWLLDHVTKETG